MNKNGNNLDIDELDIIFTQSDQGEDSTETAHIKYQEKSEPIV